MSQPVTAESSSAHSPNGSVNTPRRNLHKIIESITAARSSVSIAAATCASPPSSRSTSPDRSASYAPERLWSAPRAFTARPSAMACSVRGS